MNSGGAERLSPADYLLLALVASLPLMKPAVAYPVLLSDILFLLVAAALAVEWARGRFVVRWQPAFTVVLIYMLSLAASLAATTQFAASLFKLATQAYLAGLAAVMIVVVRSEAMLRRVTLAWLAATAVPVLLSLAGLIAFAIDPGGAIYQYSVFQFGTLPPGHYPRLSLTFFNANMACNYLTVSLGLLLLAWQRKWIALKFAAMLLAGIVIASVSTISPGIGGIALLIGIGTWLMRGSRIALTLGIGAALGFIVALAVTPIIHATAPFLIEIQGTRLVFAPSGRFLTWSAAFAEFSRHPLLGHGIGIGAVDVRYVEPSGYLEPLTDAHNVFLNIAAQAGVVGLAGLTALIAYAVRLTFSPKAGGSPAVRLILGLTFLDAFVYQGLGGSFEDARHLWVLLGLLAAASKLPVSPVDGNNRRAGAPSSG